MTFDTYIHEVMHFVAQSPRMRLGLAMWAVLGTMRPDLATEVKDSSMDPRYDDAVCEDFMMFLVGAWVS